MGAPPAHTYFRFRSINNSITLQNMLPIQIPGHGILSSKGFVYLSFLLRLPRGVSAPWPLEQLWGLESPASRLSLPILPT